MKEIKCYKELNEEFIKVNKTALTYFEPVILGNDRFDNELDNKTNDQFIINESKEINITFISLNFITILIV